MKEIHTGESILKLRAQSICCGKEADLIKTSLADVEGITAVNVNVVGRRAFITHQENVISSKDIMEKLNSLHLGIRKAAKSRFFYFHFSVVESGIMEETPNNKKKILNLRVVTIIILAVLLVGVIASTIGKYSFTVWLTIPIVVLGGIPMLYNAAMGIKRCQLININLLMLIAVAAALGLKEWLDACIVVVIFSLAELLESRVMYKVERDIEGLMMRTPEKAVLAETNQSVPVEEVAIGTLLLVTAGERIPLDGEVIKGKAAVDESSVTGEASPISKKAGSNVFSGTIIQSGFLKIKTTCDYQSSTLYRVSQLVEEAQSKGSRTEETINKFATYYTPIILIVALLLFLIPFILHKLTSDISSTEMKEWGIRALTMLLAACPCQIIMAVPIPTVCSITKALKFGVLIKGGTYLESLAEVDVMAFDKTGTLTEGRFQALKEYTLEKSNRDETIKLAASLETKSSHPLAACIVNHYSGCITDKIDELGVAVGLPDVTKFKNHEGLGLSGQVSDHVVCVGNVELMALFEVDIGEDVKDMIGEWNKEGCTVILVGVDGKLEMVLGLADKCRATAPTVIQQLQNLGLKCVMLTGDGPGSAEVIKEKVGLSYYVASMTPNEKYKWLVNKQGDGKEKHCVAMIGDGVNDSPSLVAADVGIAIGSSGAAMAVESAGISLMTDDLTKIVDLIKLGKYCKKIVWQNIFGGVFIKASFVIVALIKNNMLWLAILSDVLGLLFVVCNGLRPLRWSSEGPVTTSSHLSIEEDEKMRLAMV